MKTKNYIISTVALFTLALLAACESEEPVREDAPEMITQVTLTFTPPSGPSVVVTATDPDGEGVQNIEPDGPIMLDAGVDYTLSLQLFNALVETGADGYDIGAEVEEEGHEHMFFFGWTGTVFVDPAGDGNLEDRSESVNYLDEDINGFPVGLSTQWRTSESAASGTLRIVLKHQPDLKSSTSTADDGESDLDVEFDIVVE